MFTDRKMSALRPSQGTAARAFFAVVLWSALGCPCHAESVGEVVVTATKTERPVETTPGFTTTITRQDLRSRPIKTLEQALQWSAGVFQKGTRGLAEATPTVSMRGFAGQERTLVLLDGVPLNDGYSSAVKWSTLPVENIERIEVVRGPASALYGGGAMAGVINIVTRNPDRARTWISFSTGANEYDSGRFGASVPLNGWIRGLSAQFGFEGEETLGYPTLPVLKSGVKKPAGTITNVTGAEATTDPTGQTRQYLIGWKGDNGGTRETWDGKLRWTYGQKSSVTLMGISGDRNYCYGWPSTLLRTGSGSPVFGLDGKTGPARLSDGTYLSINSGDFLTGNGEDKTKLYALSWDHRARDYRLWAQIGKNNGNNWYTSTTTTSKPISGPGTVSESKPESTLWELRLEKPINTRHVAVIGGTLREDSLDLNQYNLRNWTDRTSKTSRTLHTAAGDRPWALFVQDEWTVSPRTTVIAGARYDIWTLTDGRSGVPGSETPYVARSKSAFSPRASVCYKLSKRTTVKVGAGKSFRAPTLYDLFRTWEFAGTTYQQNVDLDPETSSTYEAQLTRSLSSRSQLTWTCYHNDLSNLIYLRTLSTTTKRQENAGRGKTDGSELELQSRIRPWLKAWANGSWNRAVITENSVDTASVGKRVPNVPEWMANAGIDLSRKKWNGTVRARYYSKIYNKSDNSDVACGVYTTYEPTFLVDGRVGMKPQKGVEVSVSVENLFDRDYWAYYKAPGRTWLAQLRLDF